MTTDITEQERNEILDILATQGYLNLSQFAKLQRITYMTADRWRKNEKFEAIKVGGGWRIYAAEIERLMIKGNAKESS